MCESVWAARIAAFVRDSIEEPWECASIRAERDEYGINTVVRYRSVDGSVDQRLGYIDGLAEAFYQLGEAHRPGIVFSTCLFDLGPAGDYEVTFDDERRRSIQRDDGRRQEGASSSGDN